MPLLCFGFGHTGLVDTACCYVGVFQNEPCRNIPLDPRGHQKRTCLETCAGSDSRDWCTHIFLYIDYMHSVYTSVCMDCFAILQGLYNPIVFSIIPILPQYEYIIYPIQQLKLALPICGLVLAPLARARHFQTLPAMMCLESRGCSRV